MVDPEDFSILRSDHDSVLEHCAKTPEEESAIQRQAIDNSFWEEVGRKFCQFNEHCAWSRAEAAGD